VTTIVVIAKEPRAGRVKTRLCPPCTPDGAAALAAAALADTLESVQRASCTRRVLALDGAAGPWVPPGFTVAPQAEGGLGDRLAAAVTAVSGPVLVVGMDTPQLSPALLDDACARLLAPSIDAVLGPALDGGYWCIGFRHARGRRTAFRGVPMSSVDTGLRQRQRLVELGMRVDDLAPLRDVDTIDDARAVAAQIPRSSFALSMARIAA
jgi:rSAM/selenodomain-associated transferase 1